MARRSVVEIQCSRCDRKELRESVASMEYSSGGVSLSVPEALPSALMLRLGDGTKIDFEDLCAPCMGAVKSHLEAISKKITGLSPERKKKKEPVAKKKSQTPLQGLTSLRTSGQPQGGQ